MTLSRRRFLQITAAGAAAGPLGCAGTGPLDSGPLTGMLEAYIDTLLPADSAPGALQLGVHTQVRILLRRKRALVPVYRSGLEWLAAQAPQGRGFAELDLAERDALVTQLSEQSDDMLARFFHKSLRHTMVFYYTNPRAWEPFGLEAPQPAGFMDYTQPPRTHG